ncbi:1917_t:CDS:2 [Ambispora leptoticha]|uniref:1917_t:CDS:1 n=1 Tax=Ambispora leptoticha TaxID=144679 RepID=A0A9N9A2J3_9GLOM|nr:1917_t:CDS:2 [Ambispora leptoticha]
MVGEVPHLTTSTRIDDQIPAPVFLLTGPTSMAYNPTCDFLSTNLTVINTNDGKTCNEFLSSHLDSAHGNTIYIFDNTGDIPIKLTNDSIYGIQVQIQLNSNTSNLESLDNEALFSGLQISLYDATIDKTDFSKKKGNASVAYEEALNANDYLIPPNQRSIIYFNRIINNDLDGHRFRNHLGLGAKPNEYALINTKMQSVNPYNASSFKYFATLEIYYESRIVTINEQTRDITVLSILSSLGGGFGLGMAVYAFCFGAPQLGPWGWAQEVYGCRHKLKMKLGERFHDFVPLVDERPSYDDLDASESARITALERRSEALELFLRDYVVDVGDLEEFTDSYRNIIQNQNLNSEK